MPAVDIEQITQELTWALRRDALYPDQYKHNMGLPEDDNGTHYGAFYDNKLAAVVSLFQQGTEFQFRKFAVDPAMQHKGIGSQLLAYLITAAMENSATRLWCNARVTADNFYAKAGFKQAGEIFNKGGIDYVVMEKLFQ